MRQQSIIDYWVEKAGEDLASARDNLKSGRYQNAVRDAYFACFHAFSSLLLNEGKTFKKHKEVHQCSTGILFDLRESIVPGENTTIGFLIIDTRRIIGH